jgi:membrane protein DedA with SNARE-associated domain
MKYDLLATFIWVAIMLPAGWLVGRGFSLLFDIASDLKKALLIAVIVFAVYYALERLIGRRIIKSFTEKLKKRHIKINLSKFLSDIN